MPILHTQPLSKCKHKATTTTELCCIQNYKRMHKHSHAHTHRCTQTYFFGFIIQILVQCQVRVFFWYSWWWCTDLSSSNDLWQCGKQHVPQTRHNSWVLAYLNAHHLIAWLTNWLTASLPANMSVVVAKKILGFRSIFLFCVLKINRIDIKIKSQKIVYFYN